MSATVLTGQLPFGLFELDPAGTILYSRLEPDGDAYDRGGPDLAGRNFYEEVAAFGNVEEFRRQVTQFARGGAPADSFSFDCLCKGGPRPVKVLVARIREQAGDDRTKSVLVHIRKAA